jgi:hypothetical protein
MTHEKNLACSLFENVWQQPVSLQWNYESHTQRRKKGENKNSIKNLLLLFTKARIYQNQPTLIFF